MDPFMKYVSTAGVKEGVVEQKRHGKDFIYLKGRVEEQGKRHFPLSSGEHQKVYKFIPT